MAAVITALRHRREEEEEAAREKAEKASVSTGRDSPNSFERVSPDEPDRGLTVNHMDINQDGKVSPSEIEQHLQDVTLRVDLMLERLQLERNMAVMMVKVPFFLVCLFCFLGALLEFSPASQVSRVHQHLETHFELSKAKSAKTYADLYSFIETFEKHNEELQATSAKYWCENRYFSQGWNVDLLVPSRTCQSPRLHALTVGEESSRKSWSSINSGSSGSGSSGSGHRRLRGEGRELAPRGAAGDVESSNSYPPCRDDSASLALVEAKPGATCASEAAHVCETNLGVLYCPKTCGMCAPFEYDRMHKFPKPQLTMLPVVIFQTRFELADCHGFAETYANQPVNPVLSLLPALDGIKHDKVMRCIDRSKEYKGKWAIEMECPPGQAVCSPCSYDANKTCLHDTQKVDFHGIPVYPMMITEAHRDVERLKSMDWLDLQTNQVMLSTMVYTEGLEIFTSLTIEYSIDDAGNIHEHHVMISYRDLIDGSKASFIVCLIVCIVGALLGVVLSVAHMLNHPENCKWNFQVYELVSRGILFAYPLVLLISWTQQIPMSKEYDLLLHSFLDMKSLDIEDVNDAITKYFKVKTHIYSETAWLKRHRITANLVVYLQFWQLLLYFSAHPKMAMMTDTISKAFTNIVHFLFLFLALFVMMAFMAHWQLGEYIKDFATYGDAISAQGRMIFGEFIYASGAERLHDSMMFMYWLYAFTFLLVMWGLLLNFFLAIVVDAFADVNGKTNESEVVGNFFYDVIDVYVTMYFSSKYGWPRRQALQDFFMEVETKAHERQSWFAELEEDRTEIEQNSDDVVTCYPEDLMEHFPKEFKTPMDVAVFVCHYFNKIPRFLRRRVQPGATPNGRNSSSEDDHTKRSGRSTIAKDMNDPNTIRARIRELELQLSLVEADQTTLPGQIDEPKGMMGKQVRPQSREGTSNNVMQSQINAIFNILKKRDLEIRPGDSQDWALAMHEESC